MKKSVILSLIVLANLCLADVIFQSVTLTHGVASVATETTENAGSGAIINATKQRIVPVSISFKTSAANDSNVVFTFKRSVDGTTYETAGSQIVTLAANGETTVNCVTNLETWAGYIKLVSIQNLGTNAYVTNISIKYGLKFNKENL